MNKQQSENGFDHAAVMLLADTPAEDNLEVVQATAALIDCAKNARLVAVVCQHVESRKPATIICAIHADKDRPHLAEYIPLAILFTGEDSPWEAYVPPNAAIVVQDTERPLIQFSSEDSGDSNDDKPETAETS